MKNRRYIVVEEAAMFQVIEEFLEMKAVFPIIFRYIMNFYQVKDTNFGVGDK